jgi:hypothetical protein
MPNVAFKVYDLKAIGPLEDNTSGLAKIVSGLSKLLRPFHTQGSSTERLNCQMTGVLSKRRRLPQVTNNTTRRCKRPVDVWVVL